MLNTIIPNKLPLQSVVHSYMQPLVNRPEYIMLENLPIMLLSTAH